MVAQSIRAWGTIYDTQAEDNRQIFKSLHGIIKPAGGAAVKRGTARIRPGSFIRQILTGGIGGDQYYWVPSKVAKVEASPAPTTTVFYVRNPVFLAGDAITVGAASELVKSCAYVPDVTGGAGKFRVEMAAAITLPTSGMRVFSQTALENAIHGVALDELPYLAESDQATEYAIAGVFLKSAMDQFYHATDITAWLGGTVTNLDVASTFATTDAYRWS